MLPEIQKKRVPAVISGRNRRNTRYDLIPRNKLDYKPLDGLLKKRYECVKRAVIIDVANCMRLSANRGDPTVFPVLSLLRLFVLSDFDVFGVITRTDCHSEDLCEVAIIEKLLQNGLLVKNPFGSYDDNQFFVHAAELNGVVVSNDQFRDFAAVSEGQKTLRDNSVVNYVTIVLDSSEQYHQTRDRRHFMCDVRFDVFPNCHGERSINEMFFSSSLEAEYPKSMVRRKTWTIERQEKMLKLLNELILMKLDALHRENKVAEVPQLLQTTAENDGTNQITEQKPSEEPEPPVDPAEVDLINW